MCFWAKNSVFGQKTQCSDTFEKKNLEKCQQGGGVETPLTGEILKVVFDLFQMNVNDVKIMQNR